MAGHAYSAAAVTQRARSRLPSAAAGPAGALGVAAVCVLALALLWVVAELVPSAHYRDAVLLYHFTLLSRPRLDHLGSFTLHLLGPLLFICWGLALVAIALARSRPRVALAIVAILSLAPLTTELLKPLLAHTHAHFYYVYIGAASFPSGHSTAATALALSAVLVTPARLRLLVGLLAGLFALAVGCFLLILAWHMPSDVLGGYLVGGMWAALAVAALLAAERRWPTHRPL
jgi:membrane-associated phospholipid phosphatase